MEKVDFNELLSQLDEVLRFNEPAFLKLLHCVERLNHDVEVIQLTLPRQTSKRITLALEHLQSVLERNLAIAQLHQTRLGQLRTVHQNNPSDPAIPPLLQHFSMVYAACEDRLYAAEEDEHLAYTQRFVEGVLPYETMRYLVNAEQLWEPEFATNDWKGWQLALMMHRSWLATTMNTLQRTHTLTHPLHAALVELENVIEFCKVQSNNHQNVDRMIAYQNSLPISAQQNILTFELAYLQSLCIPFPQCELVPFRPRNGNAETSINLILEEDESE